MREDVSVDPKSKSIAELAYQLWEARGRPHGTAELDWHEAERQLGGSAATPRALDAKVDESVVGTFPASDPPSSHIPDSPPSNADAKWEAAGIERKQPNNDTGSRIYRK
jgi:hypothetical protein